MEGELRANVVTFLSVERNRDLKDIDQEMMTGLFNRVDREVRSALRPFGYYEPVVKSDFSGDAREWKVKIEIQPGTPVMITAVSVKIEGPGADDPVFDAIRNQTTLREGMRLHHGLYEAVKGNLTRTAAANGYLRARLVRSEMPVDVSAHKAQIDLLLDTGPRYRFGAVNIDQKVIRSDLVQALPAFSRGRPLQLHATAAHAVRARRQPVLLLGGSVPRGSGSGNADGAGHHHGVQGQAHFHHRRRLRHRHVGARHAWLDRHARQRPGSSPARGAHGVGHQAEIRRAL